MTGLIYVAIIAVWAVVLVPAWLRRHDHMDPERSVDRFSRTMQTLANRPSILGIPLPNEDAEPRAHEDEAPEVFRVSRPDLSAATARLGSARSKVSGVAAQAGSQARRTSAASRRRVVLAVLAAALLLVTGLVLVGVVMPVALVVPAGLLGGFVVAARSQVTRERRRTSTGQRRTAATAPASAAPVARRTPAAAAGGTWEARPTTLPTYVTAPPASGFPRVIDTETPGARTAAAMLERAQQEKLRAERMAAAKAEAIAKAKAEQAAAEARNRDEDFLSGEAAAWDPRRGDAPYRRRAVNE